MNNHKSETYILYVVQDRYVKRFNWFKVHFSVFFCVFDNELKTIKNKV